MELARRRPVADSTQRDLAADAAALLRSFYYPKQAAFFRSKAKRRATSKTRRAELGNGGVEQHLLLTRYNPDRVAGGDMMSVDDIKDILGIEVLGVIPESSGVLSASNAGVPVILDEESAAGQAYADAVARLAGEPRPMRFVDAQKKGLFARIFGS